MPTTQLTHRHTAGAARHHARRAPLEVQYAARGVVWLGKLGATLAVVAVLSINTLPF